MAIELYAECNLNGTITKGDWKPLNQQIRGGICLLMTVPGKRGMQLSGMGMSHGELSSLICKTDHLTLFVKYEMNREVELTIADINGKIVYTLKGMTNNNIRVETKFPSGLYIVKCLSGETILFEKTIKN